MRLVLSTLVLCFGTPAAAAFSTYGRLQTAVFEKCSLDSGEVIAPCRVSYRIMGQPDPDGSNVVLVPSWYSGTSASWEGFAGPGRLLDSSRYAFVLLDALGDGASSSPSNDRQRPGIGFPVFTIGDMVASQYAVATQVLHLPHVKAVLGISMGGMQALQWATQYPDYMDKIVSLVGTPKPTANDVRLWRWELGAFDRITGCCGGHKLTQAASTTDRMYQLRAMLRHDMTGGRGLAWAAERIHAAMLLVVDRRDTLLEPGPCLELAAATAAEVLLLDTHCGHFSPIFCASGRTRARVADFLAQ